MKAFFFRSLFFSLKNFYSLLLRFFFILRALLFFLVRFALLLFFTFSLDFFLVRLLPGDFHTQETLFALDLGGKASIFEEYSQFWQSFFRGEMVSFLYQQPVFSLLFLPFLWSFFFTLTLTFLSLFLSFLMCLIFLSSFLSKRIPRSLPFYSQSFSFSFSKLIWIVVILGNAVPVFILAPLARAWIIQHESWILVVVGGGLVLFSSFSTAFLLLKRFFRDLHHTPFLLSFYNQNAGKKLGSSVFWFFLPTGIDIFYSLFLSVFFSSSVIEKIFDLPGISSYFFEALLKRDYPLLLGALMMYSSLVIVLEHVLHFLKRRIPWSGSFGAENKGL